MESPTQPPASWDLVSKRFTEHGYRQSFEPVNHLLISLLRRWYGLCLYLPADRFGRRERIRHKLSWLVTRQQPSASDDIILLGSRSPDFE